MQARVDCAVVISAGRADGSALATVRARNGGLWLLLQIGQHARNRGRDSLPGSRRKIEKCPDAAIFAQLRISSAALTTIPADVA